ncbi:MAG: apolipoprotein N-acyltransferase [Candidatus Eremiobacteraeota bacterium]|nr:apolipoprotein N-acyltransferase [Candidatus Eremiobacteraeota bacterium]
MIATRDRAKPIHRNIFTSSRTGALLVALVSSAALTTAFPKLDIAWIAPFALAGLFWSWFASPALAALWIGFLAGFVYFALAFSWFGVTAAALVGPFGVMTVAGPALIDAPSFAIAAMLGSLAYKIAPGALGPLAAAAVFAVAEWCRSVGVMGNPFAQVGVSQVDGPLAALAAFGGSTLVTFAVAAVGAFVASAALDRARIRESALGLGAIVVLASAAYLLWPARTLAAPTIPVAAVQGNIKQDVKWDKASFEVANGRYIAMTAALESAHPRLVLWPETVITDTLGDDDQFSADDARPKQALRAQFGRLAERLHATLVVGSLEYSADGLHNALFVFSPSGVLDAIYRKRQLVPFAEWVPGSAYFRWFPYLDVLGKEVPGTDPTVIEDGAGLRVAPLICWESAFSDVVQDQLRRGATILAISTDDAWFGETAGPYQHAQIAQMRAIETGRWVLRAAATGISGIVAPDGRWTVRVPLDAQQTVSGFVGPPLATVFSRIGPWPVVYALAAFYVLALSIGWRWSARRT